MPIGLVTHTGNENNPWYAINADTNNVDLHLLYGSPATAIHYTLVIPSGITVGSGGSGVALDATGFHVDSIGSWVIGGTVVGHGGSGGDGWLNGTPQRGFGGGGGGAGYNVGSGGIGFPDGTDGDDGLLMTGGSAGNSIITSGTTDMTPAGAGGLGGNAVNLNHVVTIALEGIIGGGGAGGNGGQHTITVFYPEDGGDLGESTSTTSAGAAIRYSESGSATITGAGTTYGTIG